MKIIWRMIPETRSATDRIFGHFGLFFVLYPLPPPPTRSPSLTTQIIKILKKWKKHLQISFGYLQICADMVRDGCNCYFSFWAILFLFTPLTAQKNEKFKKMKNMSGDIIIVPTLTAQKIRISKNEKRPWRYYHFTHMYQKLWLNMYGSWYIMRDGQMDGRKKWLREVGAPPKKRQSKLNFPKTNISYPLIQTCAYQGTKNNSFMEKLVGFVFLLRSFWNSFFWVINVTFSGIKNLPTNNGHPL